MSESDIAFDSVVLSVFARCSTPSVPETGKPGQNTTLHYSFYEMQCVTIQLQLKLLGSDFRLWFPRFGQGCFILLRESKKGGSSGAQQLFTSYFYKQTVPPERKYSLFDDLSKTLQSSRLFVAINEDIIALLGSRLKVNLQRMKQPCRFGDGRG
jgi:hypothetical protein